MQKKFKLAVVIGRFQPLHTGHVGLIGEASRIAEEVLVIVGGADAPRTTKNPFTFDERRAMIEDEFGCLFNGSVVGVVDYPLDDAAWAAHINRIVNGCGNDPKEVVIVGMHKDQSSNYLDWFPDYSLKQASALDISGRALDATYIRDKLFTDRAVSASLVTEGHISKAQYRRLCNVVLTDEFKELSDEYYSLKQYRESWAVAPYPPTFVTADAVVVHDKQVLLVQRKFSPGKGLWALPGGFVNQNETMLEAAVRELKEETGVRINDYSLNTVVREATFDTPGRSLRGRTITRAFMFHLHNTAQPELTAGDDALKAEFIPISKVLSEMRSVMFEDHYHIIDSMLTFTQQE